MYVLDYKTNKIIQEVSNILLERFLETNTISKPLLYERAMNCIMANFFRNIKMVESYGGYTLLHCKHFKHNLVINGNIIKRKVSAVAHQKILEWLDKEGYIILMKGYVSCFSMNEDRQWILGDKIQSSYHLQDKFIEEIRPYLDRYILPPENNVIIMRKDKQSISFKMDAHVSNKKNLLQQYNLTFIDGYIQDKEGNNKTIQLYKVYTNNFKQNGRNHTMYSSFQNTPSADRALCKYVSEGIEYPLAELDFKHLHPSLLYSREGITIEDGFDPYFVENIYNVDKDEWRSFCKLALVTLINCQNLRQGILALSGKLQVDYAKTDDKKFESIHEYTKEDEDNKLRKSIAMSVVNGIKGNNPLISKYFHTGIGLELMNVESEIIDLVLEHFVNKGVFVVPIHDSVAVIAEYVDELYEIMRESYKRITGSYDNCKIERKY